MKYQVISCGLRDIAAIPEQPDSPYIIFLDEKYTLEQDALNKLDEYINNADRRFAAFEMRVRPVETGKHYDPVSLETKIIDDFCFAVSRQAYNAAGGLDFALSAYCRAVDLSRRLTAAGYKLMYCPKSCVSLAETDYHNRERNNYLQSTLAKLLWAYKYGNKADVKQRNEKYVATLKNPKHFEGVRKELLKNYLGHFRLVSKLKKRRKNNLQLFSDISAEFPVTAYRGQITLTEKDFTPFVSVVIRTHKRPAVLRKTLESLTHQLYKNFEVVIMEDGAFTAEKMPEEFPQLNIRYFSTGEHVGRGKAGNMGIEKANGEYIIFLDDDDYFYADCISTFVAKFRENPRAEMVISGGMAFRCRVKSTEPYIYEATEIYPILFDHITLMDMCVRCRIPMPCGMFKKDLYYRHGGMREDIGGDEDWAMWLKFMKDAVRINPYGPDIDKALSMFGYPADEAAAKKREEDYRVFDRQMLYDENMVFTVPGSEVQKWESYVQADINHLRNIGRLDSFIKELKPLDTEKLEYSPEDTLTLTAKQINNYYYWLVYSFAETEKA